MPESSASIPGAMGRTTRRAARQLRGGEPVGRAAGPQPGVCETPPHPSGSCDATCGDHHEGPARTHGGVPARLHSAVGCQPARCACGHGVQSPARTVAQLVATRSPAISGAADTPLPTRTTRTGGSPNVPRIAPSSSTACRNRASSSAVAATTTALSSTGWPSVNGGLGAVGGAGLLEDVGAVCLSKDARPYRGPPPRGWCGRWAPEHQHGAVAARVRGQGGARRTLPPAAPAWPAAQVWPAPAAGRTPAPPAAHPSRPSGAARR
jgi:hypothetical protein